MPKYQVPIAPIKVANVPNIISKISAPVTILEIRQPMPSMRLLKRANFSQKTTLNKEQKALLRQQ